MGGSFALGAWGEASLFFEPIGRKQGNGVRVEVQTKDGAPVPGFRLSIHVEGPADAPTSLALVAENVGKDTSADDVLLQALAAAPKTDAVAGSAGICVVTLATTLKRSDKTVRRALKRLVEAKLAVVIGKATKGKDLYAICE